MLQELSHMDRITQLQDEIQQVRLESMKLRVILAGLTSEHSSLL